MTKAEVYAVHLHDRQECYSPKWLCWRRHAWRAWCPCGWKPLYEGRSAARHMLGRHLEDGHGGADD